VSGGCGAIPLIAHDSPQAVLALRAGTTVSAGHYLADVRDVAARLPSGNHVLNLCADRYRFAVGLGACLITRRVSLLPSTHTPEVIREMARFAPDVVCITDEAACDIDLPQMQFPEELRDPGERRVREELRGAVTRWEPPRIDGSQVAAIVFTSGSTGTPLPHRKTWSRLSRCVRDGAPRLGLIPGISHTLVGTVPPQHMYGFESTVLVALQTGNAFDAERPFYPADICAALARAPRPRLLISTPIHLRTLLGAGIDLPAVDLIVSATAPLERELAVETERRFGAALVEIYGSTETGQIATRRTTETPAWQLWPGVRLECGATGTFAAGGHVEERTALCDVLEPQGAEQFLLHGRSADLVNIAGKRSSFGYLNHRLNAIPGVVDGAFFARDAVDSAIGVSRLAAVVVAPQLSAHSLLERLRECIDPVFLPRPLLMVERLPRTAAGKLPQHALRALLAGHA